MAQNDVLKRLLDAGMTFTAMTQARAEEVIRDLVRAGEVQAEQAQSVVDELVDRSRRNSERLIDAVRSEIRQQVASLGLATKDDVERLERRIADVATAQGTGRTRTRKAAAKTTIKKGGARKKATKKAAKKATKKAPARKTTATKATTRKSTAKKTSTKKSPARKATR
jgi:polyhydroxyalkanoate synthesis regulator phasin